MKALKTVAVALGITLGALIVIPLAVLAGLFVWLKLTEEEDEEILELDQRRRLIDPWPGPGADRRTRARRRRPAGRPAASPARVRRGCPTLARPASDRRLAELAVLVVMVFWAGNFIVVKGAVEILPPVGFTFLRYLLASATLLALLRWREGAHPAAARRRRCAICAPRRRRLRLLPDPLAGRPPDDPGR